MKNEIVNFEHTEFEVQEIELEIQADGVHSLELK